MHSALLESRRETALSRIQLFIGRALAAPLDRAATRPGVRRAELPELRGALAADAPVSHADLMQRMLDQGIARRRGIMVSSI